MYRALQDGLNNGYPDRGWRIRLRAEAGTVVNPHALVPGSIGIQVLAASSMIFASHSASPSAFQSRTTNDRGVGVRREIVTETAVHDYFH